MRYTEAELLRSEIGTVEQLLDDLSADAIIVRSSFEQRLEVLRERLAEVEVGAESSAGCSLQRSSRSWRG